MTFVLQGEVRVAGEGARAELAKVKASQDTLKASAKGVSSEGRKAAAETKKIGDKAAVAAGKVDTLADQERRAALEAKTLGQAHQRAAGQVGNLTAQFNDIGVMMAAGQNPLQLALQQGTQITQVIGPLGATGAVRALGSAFMSLLSPINLVTLGTIAGGAALIQWLTDAGEEALSLEDAVSTAGDAIEAFKDKSDAAGMSLSGMLEQFGSASPELRAILKDMAALGKLDAYRAIDQTTDSLRALAKEERIFNFNNMRRAGREAALEFKLLLETLSRSEDPAQKLAAALDLRSQLLANAGGIEQLDGAQRQFYDGLAATIRDLIVLGAQVEETTSRTQTQQLAYYGQTRAASAAQLASAEAMLLKLGEENALREATVRYGRNSAEVVALRADAEREAFEETLATMEVAESLKTELREAFEHGQLLSQLEMGGTIAAAATEAARLAENLGISLASAQKIAALGPQGSPAKPAGRGGDPREFGGSIDDWQNRDAIVFLENYKPPKAASSSGGGGGGSAGYGAQDDALRRLISTQERQLAILREIDPVQREMLRYREQLAGASDAQRQSLEQLIGTRLREEEAMRGVADQEGFFRDITRDSIRALTSDTENLGDVFDRLAASIAEAALEAALFGEGPLAGLLGGSGGGGLFGFITDAVVPKAATGGYLTGPGSGTSDNIPMFGSSGEFMVNAKATARHRPLLEAINSGSPVIGLATGGPVSQGALPALTQAPGSAQAAGGLLTVRIIPGPEFDARVESTSQNVAVEVVQNYDSSVLPSSVERINNDPRATS